MSKIQSFVQAGFVARVAPRFCRLPDIPKEGNGEASAEYFDNLSPRPPSGTMRTELALISQILSKYHLFLSFVYFYCVYHLLTMIYSYYGTKVTKLQPFL